MKKILSLLMVVSLLLTCSTTVFAYKTTISYEGEGSSEWTLEVPISMAPGETKEVTLDGSWDSKTTINVTTDETVILKNSLESSETKELAVTFNDISKVGDNLYEISLSEDISVEDFGKALFGTWRGIITYVLTVDIDTNVAEVNGEEYESLQEAIDAAGLGDTVTLTSSVEESVIIAEDDEIIIDLNGYNIIGEYTEGTALPDVPTVDDYSAIVNEGVLTITGDGIVDGRTDTSAALFNKGTAILSGGTYTRSLCNSTEVGVSYNENDINNYYTIMNIGTLTIDGENVLVESDSIKSSSIANGWNSTAGLYRDKAGELIVNAGSIVGGRHAITNNNGNITIFGGSILSRNVGGKDAIGHDKGVLTINGGEIISSTGIAITAESNSEIVINDGLITGGIDADSTVIITDNR